MSQKKENYFLPVLPLRDTVVFPNMIVPLFIGRDSSVAAIEDAMSDEKLVFLAAQKDYHVEQPKPNDIYRVGTVASVLQMLHLPDGTLKILVEGLYQAKIKTLLVDGKYWTAELVDYSVPLNSHVVDLSKLVQQSIAQFLELIRFNKKIPPEVGNLIKTVKEPRRIADAIAAHLSGNIADRQKILEEVDLVNRFKLLTKIAKEEVSVAQIESRLQSSVRKQVDRTQQKYYLREKMNAIQDELEKMGEAQSAQDELKELEDKINRIGMSVEAKEKALNDLRKLKQMPAMAAEATVIRNYLDWITYIPWKIKTKLKRSLSQAEKHLEADHYGLEKVKERILEYLAVGQRVDKIKGPILCLVGPPGVGKTSLGQSIADATGRKFVRVALGGVRDEAEIRGHRRTYIGALPGKVIQKMAKVKVKNPLFMLDEVDKMAMDFRGDPASALLEVLDPEQNDKFNDHYLEVDYDLSDVMFIATANSLDIPPALADRMEIIRLPGYTEIEKFHIAKKYLIPKQRKQNGLKAVELHINDSVIYDIIRYYTKEAGVRGLEREFSKICRKVVKEILMDSSIKRISLNQKLLEKYLGVKRYRFGLADHENQIGQVTGLAWTEVGGELLKIQAQILQGRGKSVYTGSLGDVMQESIQTAMSVVRSRSDDLNIPVKFYFRHDFHIHVPEGATPKDGPSAGIGMCTALVSALTQNPIKSDIAMTGEITLRGEVLPIGGLKEKLLAAMRGGITTVIIPDDNRRDLKDLPKEIHDALTIHPVKWIDDVWAIALERPVIKSEKE